MRQFLWGALAMASSTAGLFFLRFWRESRERILFFFCVAFFVFALSWLMLAASGQGEALPYVYGTRLAAFLLIIVGILDKNRGNRRR